MARIFALAEVSDTYGTTGRGLYLRIRDKMVFWDQMIVRSGYDMILWLIPVLGSCYGVFGVRNASEWVRSGVLLPS